MAIYKEYLNQTSGLTLPTPGLVLHNIVKANEIVPAGPGASRIQKPENIEISTELFHDHYPEQTNEWEINVI